VVAATPSFPFVEMHSSLGQQPPQGVIHQFVISGAGGANLSTHGATGATGATGASGGSRPAGSGRGDFIHISNTPRSKKGAEMQEMAEIDELLQEYGLE